MHFTYIHNGENTKQKENGNYRYHYCIWWQKEMILFQIYIIYAERSLADFYSRHMISTIISATADEGPD